MLVFETRLPTRPSFESHRCRLRPISCPPVPQRPARTRASPAATGGCAPVMTVRDGDQDLAWAYDFPTPPAAADRGPGRLLRLTRRSTSTSESVSGCPAPEPTSSSDHHDRNAASKLAHAAEALCASAPAADYRGTQRHAQSACYRRAHRWWIDPGAAGPAVPTHANAGTAIRGTRSDLLLWLTNRSSPGSLEVTGRHELLDG